MKVRLQFLQIKSRFFVTSILQLYIITVHADFSIKMQLIFVQMYVIRIRVPTTNLYPN